VLAIGPGDLFAGITPEKASTHRPCDRLWSGRKPTPPMEVPEETLDIPSILAGFSFWNTMSAAVRAIVLACPLSLFFVTI
jgi:hypothetical protein